MSKLVRGPLASKIKQAVAVSYKDVDEQDYEGMISGAWPCLLQIIDLNPLFKAAQAF